MSETRAKWAGPWLSSLGPLIGLLLVYLFFAFIGPDSFTSIRTLETIARQTAIVGTAALGMTLVIILGGIDLSVGSIVAMTSVVVALVLNGGGGPAAAILMAMLAGALTGLTSGTLITRLKVAPFIVTLGMLLLVRGVAKGLGKEQKVDAPITWLVELLSSLPPDRRWMLVPPGVWMLALLALATAVVLRYTRLGAHIFSIGSNEKTARLCGVHVERVKVTVYHFDGRARGPHRCSSVLTPHGWGPHRCGGARARRHCCGRDRRWKPIGGRGNRHRHSRWRVHHDGHPSGALPRWGFRTGFKKS